MTEFIYLLAKLIVSFLSETIHQYLKINWENIITVKERIPDIREFIGKTKEVTAK